jgi:hypothetical protein
MYHAMYTSDLEGMVEMEDKIVRVIGLGDSAVVIDKREHGNEGEEEGKAGVCTGLLFGGCVMDVCFVFLSEVFSKSFVKKYIAGARSKTCDGWDVQRRLVHI